MPSDTAQLPAIGRFVDHHAAVVVLTLDATGRILTRNGYAERLLGDESRVTALADVLVEFAVDAEPVAVLGASSEPRPVHFATARGLPTTLSTLVRAVGDHYLLLASPDVEELERLRHELLTVNNELGTLSRQVQKTNAELERLHQLKNRFLGMAAHDLRKPLGLVMTYCDLLADDLVPDEMDEQRHYVDRIRAASATMRRLVDDYLDVALLEAGEFPIDPGPVQLEELVPRALELVAPAASRQGVAVVWTAPDEPLALEADGAKLEQVVVNLVGNGVEHSVAEQAVEVSAHRDEEGISLEVADRGPGIPPELRESLFEPFRRGGGHRGKGRSIGLGLAIARMIVVAHGGRLGFRDRPGGGTVFQVRLPLEARTRK